MSRWRSESKMSSSSMLPEVRDFQNEPLKARIVSVSKGGAIGRRKRVAMAALEENNALFPIFILTIMVLALVPYTILKLCHAVLKQARASIASAVTALFQESTEVILQADFKLLNVQ